MALIEYRRHNRALFLSAFSGGLGFSAEAPMERAYRDARISRIYEGTNEINRILLVGMAIKRALKEEIDLLGPAMAVAKELTSVPDFGTKDMSGIFSREKEVLKNLKKAVLMVAGKAVQDFGPGLNEEQEILMCIADMMIEVYATESTLLRTEKLIGIKGEEACRQQVNMTRLYLYMAVDKIQEKGKEAIVSFAKGDEQKMMLMGLKRFTRLDAYNVKELRRSVANELIEKNAYIF